MLHFTSLGYFPPLVEFSRHKLYLTQHWLVTAAQETGEISDALENNKKKGGGQTGNNNNNK